MPISADLTDAEREFFERLPPDAFLPGGGFILGSGEGVGDDGPRESRKPVFLRALTGKLFGSS